MKLHCSKMICNWMAAAVGLLIPATIGLSILLSERNVHVETILDSGGSRALSSLSLYRDPATVVNKIGQYDDSMTEQQIQRANCQIVYILGVEGTMHHGISPVLLELAKHQKDPATGKPYFDVRFESRFLRFGLFGSPGWAGRKIGFNEDLDIEDPKLVQKVISTVCPNNGKRHVLIDGASFPSGDNTKKTQLRVKRQNDWQTMTPEEISMSPTALEHPMNLERFYNAYSPYANIKFVVLHRPHIETIASHADFDGGPIVHSNVIQGFLLILSRFLDRHRLDTISGEKLWSVFRVERLAVRYYGPRDKRENHGSAFLGRHQLIYDLATFLGWPVTKCQYCFATWKDSSKDYTAMFSPEELALLEQHAADVQPIWPPRESYI